MGASRPTCALFERDFHSRAPNHLSAALNSPLSTVSTYLAELALSTVLTYIMLSAASFSAPIAAFRSKPTLMITQFEFWPAPTRPQPASTYMSPPGGRRCVGESRAGSLQLRLDALVQRLRANSMNGSSEFIA